MVSLENIREKTPVGAYALYSTKFPELMKNPLPLLYIEYSNTAFYLTKFAFEQFENEKIIGNNQFLFPSIIFWFLSFESYENSE